MLYKYQKIGGNINSWDRGLSNKVNPVYTVAYHCHNSKEYLVSWKICIMNDK